VWGAIAGPPTSVVLHGSAAVLGRLPGSTAAWVGCRLGDLLAMVLPRRRRLALDNLARAFPEMSPRDHRRLCRAFYRHLGQMIIELCSLLAWPLERTLSGITLDGREHLQAAMAAAGRALLLTAHVGNWELLAAAHRLTGYPLAIVARPLDSGLLDLLARHWRQKTGIEVIEKRGAARPVLAALNGGTMVGILLDQNAARREAVFVPFFGALASTSRSIAVLAIRTRTPILPVFIHREQWGRHRAVIHPPLQTSGANASSHAVVELTMRCTAAIEAAVRESPEQWFWMHNRWRTRPASEKATS
jgi:Kdo2-lipid IVA lauroyltransferase/acyltransferase